jgi:flagellar biosynthetic protein FliP
MTTSMRVIALLTVLSLLPALVLTMTSFTRVVVVLSFVKQGLGTQAVPPPQALIGIAMFITAFVMAPIANDIATNAYEPFMANQITEEVALDRAIKPLKSFMLKPDARTGSRALLRRSQDASTQDARRSPDEDRRAGLCRE